MKHFRKVLPIFLAIVMAFSTSLTAFASTPSVPLVSTSTNAEVIITDTGISVNGTYYSQEEFVQLLSSAQEVNYPKTRSAVAGALVAGTWFIPGLGEVIITAAGTVLIAGAIVEVGSWAYNAVVKWFADRAVQAAYKEAKEAGEPTDDHSTQDVSEGASLPKTGRPNSSKDLKDKQGVKQRRYYDKDGNADMDIDYRHGGSGHKFPHRHDWNNGTRGPAY